MIIYLSFAFSHDDSGTIGDLEDKFMKLGHILQDILGLGGVLDEQIHGSVGKFLPIASKNVCFFRLGGDVMRGFVLWLCLHLRGYKLIINLDRDKSAASHF